MLEMESWNKHAGTVHCKSTPHPTHRCVCQQVDLVEYDEYVFNKIRDDFTKFSSRLGNIVDVTFIPIALYTETM